MKTLAASLFIALSLGCVASEDMVPDEGTFPPPTARPTAASNCARQPRACMPTAHSYRGPILDASDLDGIESEETQGIAQSGTHWYWMSRFQIARVPMGESITSPIDAVAGIPPELAALGYDHFGDGDFFGDRLYVPLTGDYTVGAVVVFDRDLHPLSWARLGADKGGAWVAVNPQDGRLYTSNPWTTVHAYELTDFGSFSEERSLPYAGTLEISLRGAPAHSCPSGSTDPCVTWWDGVWVQGGAFSPNGTFYSVLDHAQAKFDHLTGVHAYDLSSGIHTASPAVELPLSGGQGKGYMHIGYDANASTVLGDISRGHELEGTTVLRDANGSMHVLAIKLANRIGTDEVTLFDFVTNEL